MSARLAWEVKQRRGELGLSQQALARQGEVTLATLGAVERGERRTYQPTTLAGLDRAMKWEPGRSQRIIDGERDVIGHGAAVPAGDAGTVEALTAMLARAIEEVRRPPSPADELLGLAMHLTPEDMAVVLRLMRHIVALRADD